MKHASKPPTVFDVARVSGFSTATVSRVLNGQAEAVSPDTAEKVLSAVRTLGYTPSAIGRSLRSASSRVVALLVPDATNDFCADVAISLEGALQEQGLSMMLCNTAERPDQQDQQLAAAEGLRPQAIVLLGAIDTPKLREVAATPRRLVFVNRRPPPPIVAPFVGVDNEAAGRAVAGHLLEKGHTDCAVIHGPRMYSASRSRLEGFLGVMSANGVIVAAEHQIESALTMEAGYEHGLRLLALDAPPKAIFCGNDMIAYGIYRAAQERGIAVPDGLAIVGFDDNRVNAWLAPWLTTVRVPALDFGPAVASIVGRAALPQRAGDVILPFSLTVRRST